MENGYIVICGEDAHHMTHVLRMRCGESVVVCVPDTGIEYETTFVSGGDPVLLQIVSEKRAERVLHHHQPDALCGNKRSAL